MKIPMMTRTTVENMIAVLGIDQGDGRSKISPLARPTMMVNCGQDIPGGNGRGGPNARARRQKKRAYDHLGIIVVDLIIFAVIFGSRVFLWFESFVVVMVNRPSVGLVVAHPIVCVPKIRSSAQE